MNDPNLYDLFLKVGGIEGKLETIEKNINKVIENHENRINVVEKVSDQLVGKITIFGAIAGFIGGIITATIGYFLKK